MFGAKKSAKTLERTKADYEYAIKRCYGFENVTLALYSFEHFTGFNVERGVAHRRVHHLYNDGFIMKGVVDEHTQFDRHIPCTLDIHNDVSSAREGLGDLMLTHLIQDERAPPEARKLLLQVGIYDNNEQYAPALCQNLRDAAISGNQFMHVRLRCSPPDEDDSGSPVDLMRERGYGPSRRVTELHMWPSVVLPNAPAWARHTD